MVADILNDYQLKIDVNINGIIRKDEVVPFSNFLLNTILPIFSDPSEPWKMSTKKGDLQKITGNS